MSSVTTTSLADTLFSSVPKLDASGLNWAVFLLHFQDAVEAKGYWGHFDGISECPAATKPEDLPATTADAPAPAAPSAEDLAAAINQWNKNKPSVKSLLTQKIPNSALMHIQNKKSVKKCWDTITSEYTKKGTFVQTDLWMHFLESKCPDKGNIQQFLDELHMEQEELATVGVDIDEKDYHSTIISSLPYSLANFTLNQLATAKLYSSTKTITPDTLISLISEEYKCQQVQRSCQNGGNGKAKDQDHDEALSVMLSEKFNGKGRFKRKPHEVCWNCGEKSHLEDKCLKPATDKKNDSLKSKSGTANAMIGSDSEDKGAFFMEPAFGSDSNGNESNDGGYGSDDDDGWFSERGSDWETEELSGVDGSEHGSLVDIDLDLVVATEPDELAALVGVGKVNLPHAKIYDSSCSKHLMPYHDALENFVEIPPKTFQAANKQTMSAVGMGEIIVDVPNGANILQLRLTEVLYSPEVGVME